MEVQQVSLDFTDRGLTPLPEVGPEKGKAVCSGEKPGLCTSELQSVQNTEYNSHISSCANTYMYHIE